MENLLYLGVPILKLITVIPGGLVRWCIGSSTAPMANRFDCCSQKYKIVVYYHSHPTVISTTLKHLISAVSEFRGLMKFVGADKF